MKVLCFGELMLRLTPSVRAGRLCTADSLSVDFAGAETNVASSLARLGSEVGFVSKLPENALGDSAVSSLNSHYINTDRILRGGERIGTYFIELGSSIRPSSVIYDRKGSAISAIEPGEFDWKTILSGQEWLHLSGITPALSDQCAAETVKAAETARALGVKVSFDLNYRRTLFDSAEQARDIFQVVLNNTDLVHGNLGVLADVFSLTYDGESALEKTCTAVTDIRQRFGVERAAFTVRDHTSASENILAGVYANGDVTVHSGEYSVDILDRFGTGDAFAAGILHGIASGFDDQKTVDFAAAAFALKHTIIGDQNTATEQEILSIMDGNTSGHVIR